LLLLAVKDKTDREPCQKKKHQWTLLENKTSPSTMNHKIWKSCELTCLKLLAITHTKWKFSNHQVSTAQFYVPKLHLWTCV
jgi:hypothetical protein